MDRKTSIKEKVVKMYKKNDTAGLIYITFLRNKSNEEKRKAIDTFIEIAEISNKDKFLRAKALAILGFFKNMCCGDKVEEFYKDGSIICEYKDVYRIVEDNCKELIQKLESSVKIDINEDFEFYKILSQVIYCLNAYQVNPDIVFRLLDLLEEKTNLAKREKSANMSQRDLHIQEQIVRIRKELN